MYQLHEDEIDVVLARITAGVQNASLAADLLDHYCCHMEEAMGTGADFETAYRTAYQAITPGGTHEIQEELFFLLTFKKQTNMKRLIYGAGFLATFLISSGLLFRFLQWPGANVIMISGFGALIVTLIALLTSSLKHMKTYPASYNVRVFAGFIAGMLISAGSMFKGMHWPTANIQILLGMVILNVVFLPLFFYHLYQKAIAKI